MPIQYSFCRIFDNRWLLKKKLPLLSFNASWLVSYLMNITVHFLAHRCLQSLRLKDIETPAFECEIEIEFVLIC